MFFKQPEPFDFTTTKERLAYSLGATLYCPATRPNLYDDIYKMRDRGAGSLVLCLEDSVPDAALPAAEKNLQETLKKLAQLDQAELKALPLLFIRVRTPRHFKHIIEMNRSSLDVLTGFVFPKFIAVDNVAQNFISTLEEVNATRSRHLYFMPVLESPEIIYRESRQGVLTGIHRVIANHPDLLAVRIGATDMSSVFGIRRTADFTVYDVDMMASAIGDIANMFARAHEGTLVTGAVWEHFNAKRIFKPTLRETPFADDKKLRQQLLTNGDDSFIREIQLDRMNGIQGKTIIHPSHIALVHSLYAVTHEEWSDAATVLSEENATGGAVGSFYKNKMNEIKPHFNWAQKTMHRASIFGVLEESVDWVDVLEAGITE